MFLLLSGCGESTGVQRLDLDQQEDMARRETEAEPEVTDDPRLFDPLQRPNDALRVPSASGVGNELGPTNSPLPD